MLNRTVCLLLAHATAFSGTILSGMILGYAIAAGRSLNLLAWAVLAAVVTMQAMLTGIHVARSGSPALTARSARRSCGSAWGNSGDAGDSSIRPLNLAG